MAWGSVHRHEAVNDFLREPRNDLFAIRCVKRHPRIHQRSCRHPADEAVFFNQNRFGPASTCCYRCIDPRWSSPYNDYVCFYLFDHLSSLLWLIGYLTLISTLASF
ncbi:hypothetical protein D3C85_1059700 [compost metagenome]